MKAIWRKAIDITDEQVISAPGLTRILAVDDRRGEPEVWFEVDLEQELAEIELWIIGTGHTISEEVAACGLYVGHFLAHGGQFVGHVYASKPMMPKVE